VGEPPRHHDAQTRRPRRGRRREGSPALERLDPEREEAAPRSAPRHLRHPTPSTRSRPHALTRGVRVLTVFAPPPLGGRGAGALVECGVHPDLDIALEGS
jgi:hypothetical protein